MEEKEETIEFPTGGEFKGKTIHGRYGGNLNHQWAIVAITVIDWKATVNTYFPVEPNTWGSSKTACMCKCKFFFVLILDVIWNKEFNKSEPYNVLLMLRLCVCIRFHGPGTLYFPHGGKLEATWYRGQATGQGVGGKYIFNDQLEYQEDRWDYSTLKDRRFYSEICDGIKPAGYWNHKVVFLPHKNNNYLARWLFNLYRPDSVDRQQGAPCNPPRLVRLRQWSLQPQQQSRVQLRPPVPQKC